MLCTWRKKEQSCSYQAIFHFRDTYRKKKRHLGINNLTFMIRMLYNKSKSWFLKYLKDPIFLKEFTSLLHFIALHSICIFIFPYSVLITIVQSHYNCQVNQTWDTEFNHNLETIVYFNVINSIGDDSILILPIESRKALRGIRKFLFFVSTKVNMKWFVQLRNKRDSK